MSKMTSAMVMLAMMLAALAQPVAVLSADDHILTVQVVPRPSMSVPLGAQRVTMLTVRFSASCHNDIHISSMTLHHKALGDFRDVQRVYAMFNGVRQTRTAPMVGNEGTATIRWYRGLTVAACTSVSLDILADFSPDAVASGEHALALESREDVDADAPVRILVNPAGTPSVTIPVGKVSGTVIVEYLSLPNTLSYGSARTVARLRLRADSRQDQAVSAITFVNDGTARGDDLQNFVLETSGHTRLSATVLSLDGDRVRLELDPPMVLRRNEVRVVQLLADIRASRRKTVKLLIQEPGDLESAPVR